MIFIFKKHQYFYVSTNRFSFVVYKVNRNLYTFRIYLLDGI